MTTADKRQAREGSGPPTFNSNGKMILAFAATGAVGILLYATRFSMWLSVVGSALMFALACAATGSLIGFLFGIPRALSAEEKSTTGIARFNGNTNLEQVSDWLTKLVLGASLTQLPEIRSFALTLFRAVAPSFGNDSTSAAFAGFVAVYYVVVGFVSGWLVTRLRLGNALQLADQAQGLIDAADRVEAQGNHEEASTLRREAADLLLLMASPSADYATARRIHPAGTYRTYQLEDIMSSARDLARSATITQESIRELFHSGSEGNRISAIAIMQTNPKIVDVELAIDAIQNSRSAFEQYQSLIALKSGIEDGKVFTELEIHSIRNAFETARMPIKSRRRVVADEILKTLGGEPRLFSLCQKLGFARTK